MNPSYKLGKHDLTGENIIISKEDFNKYLTLRELEGITKKWYYQCELYLRKNLDFVDWKIDEKKTLEYYKILNSKSLSYYKKGVYQIRKFLTYLDIEWTNDIKLPADQIYLPKRITISEINDTLDFFKNHQYYYQLKSLILLGSTSGARALELYQLKIKDINLDDRVIHINHNTSNGQSTKTKQSRVSFFTIEAKKSLEEYLTYFTDDSGLKELFSQSHITRLFKDAPLQVKDLRKFFSQEWDRRGGQTSIKKILVGHSLKGDVDLMHYNYQSTEDLKKIYDSVMGESGT